MMIYPLHLKVPARLLSPILELLEGEGITVQIGKPEAEAPTPRRHCGGHRERRTRGGFGYRAVLTVASKTGSRAEVKKLFVKSGFKETSAHNAITKALRAGLAIAQPNNRLSLTPAGSLLLEEITGDPKLSTIEREYKNND